MTVEKNIKENFQDALKRPVKRMLTSLICFSTQPLHPVHQKRRQHPESNKASKRLIAFADWFALGGFYRG